MYYREGPVRFSRIMPLTKRLKHIFSNPALIMGLSLSGLCLVIAVLLLGNFPSRSSESRTIEGLASPRGLSPLGDGSLLIAEGGAKNYADAVSKASASDPVLAAQYRNEIGGRR